MKRALRTGLVLLPLALGAREGWAQGAMIRGKVLDEQGGPLAGVKVELKFTGKEPQTFVRTTNEKGGFVQVGLPGGSYTLRFSKDGYSVALHEVRLDAGSLSEVPPVTLKAAAAVAPPKPTESQAAATQAGEVVGAFARAREATRAGRFDEAEALYREILTKAPDLAEAHFNLGVLHQKKKEWGAAEAEFKKVIALQPDKSDTYSALAAIYDATGRGAEALALLSDAATRFEGDATFQFNLGVTCINAGRTDAAVTALRKAQELDPSRVDTHFYLGTLAIGAGDVSGAVKELETYLSLSGQNPQNLATAQKLLETLKKPAGR